jgi:hypothetical protein
MKKSRKNPFQRQLYNAMKIALIFGLTQGCAPLWGGYGPDKQPRKDFERRVEAAFRLQNKMTSEVMMLQSDGSNAEEHEPIIQAEQIMEKNCSYLNEYVSRDIDGKNKGFLLQRRVQNSVANCEKSAKNVEEFLKKHQR